MTHNKSVIFVALALTAAVSGQQAPIGYDDTPMQPNGKWRVHDGTRPYPVDRHAAAGGDASVAAPSDAHRAARRGRRSQRLADGRRIGGRHGR